MVAVMELILDILTLHLKYRNLQKSLRLNTVLMIALFLHLSDVSLRIKAVKS